MPISNITTEEVAKRTMNLFFLVDTSGSMAGRKIAALNQAVRESLPIIKEISQENGDANIKIAVLEFSDGVKWMYDEPLDANDFEWTDLGVDCLTCFGKALGELNTKMSCKEFMASLAYQPVIIVLSDGAPTDDYKHNLEKLKENNWFKAATKIAIAIGDDASKDVLTEFTGNPEAVFSADNVFMLKNIIKVASVTSSLIGSQSSTSSEKTKSDKIIDKIIDEIEDKEKEQEEQKNNSSSNDGDDDIFAGF
ncbi:MAG: hypothetical protein NC344_06480 [Bacteroidales bacterium]|nr:hypothetical protein [Bacteroidales bacterium]MCM1147465.1 hypothetical protein [Bacteroidales bacterium]MCM1206134.1 hypothetical protein [Bacillota bacterium]MCM1510035.1 hypothetical protein [Clostridium sp.]